MWCDSFSIIDTKLWRIYFEGKEDSGDKNKKKLTVKNIQATMFI